MDVAVVVAVVETTKVESLEVFFSRCVSFLVVYPAACFSLATPHVHCLVKVQRIVSRTIGCSPSCDESGLLGS